MTRFISRKYEDGEHIFVLVGNKTKRTLRDNKNRGKVRKVANCTEEFIVKQVLGVFFNLVHFGVILCCDESFSCVNKLLK